MHACMDARDLMNIKRWQRAFFFPPCYQQLRADVDCLPLKIKDGRAFWGSLLVIRTLWADAEVIVTEQPDSVVADYMA